MEMNFFKGNVIEWAITYSRMDFDRVEAVFSDINDLISEKKMLSYARAKKLADFLKIPFGFLFFDEVPKFKSKKHDFRTIANERGATISKDLSDVIYDIENKQQFASEMKRENDQPKVDYPSLVLTDPEKSAENLHLFLQLKKPVNMIANSARDIYVKLRSIIESKGVFVLQNGVVGQDNHRVLDLSEFRGFAIYDEYAPFIFVNSIDIDQAKIFTLLHEYCHLALFGDSNLYADNPTIDGNLVVERQINDIVSHFLLPTNSVLTYVENKDIDIDFIKNMAYEFKCSIKMCAVRLLKMNLIEQELIDLVIEETSSVKPRNKGGNYYHNIKSRLGNSFSELVFDSVDSYKITLNEGYRLLGVYGPKYLSYKALFNR